MTDDEYIRPAAGFDLAWAMRGGAVTDASEWAALRDGVRGELLDLRTRESRSTLLRLHDLIDAAEPYAPGGLDDVRAMVEVENLRELGPERVVPWLAEVFSA